MKTDPFFKIRYASGLGDIVRCILHSRLIGPITKFITKQDKPCIQCQQRAQALNILFPIDLWWIYFKSKEERSESLKKEAIEYGYEFQSCSERQQEINESEIEKTNNSSELIINNSNTPVENYYKDGHVLVQQSETTREDLKIVILFYKKV